MRIKEKLSEANKMKIKEKINRKKLSEAAAMILILMISTFAFSYILADVSKPASAQTNESTGSTGYSVCCEKTKEGQFCQNTIPGECDSAFRTVPTNCDSTSFCKLGCCYDSGEGTCAENTPQKVCELRNGTYDANAKCEIPQCELGCCVLGGDANLVTLTRCKKLANYYGLEVDFRSNIKSEAECIEIAQAADKGACVFLKENEKTCKFLSRAECNALGNGTKFNKDFLCSAEELGTNCAKQHHTGCVEGKEEVYWFDSCNNPENIYDANKEKSWNNGKILSKEDSCNSESSNAKSKSCGNCNYYLGSICGKARTGIEPQPTYGDYECRDLNCYNTYDGTNRKHGESWCVFDSKLGNGLDVVGSRQWRHLCIAGEEKVEPCADYRQEVCVQEKLNTTVGNFNEAVCRTNRWKECLSISTKMNEDIAKLGISDVDKVEITNKAKAECGNVSDCYWTTIWAGKVNLCLPSYPAGLSGLGATTESEGASAASVCSLATTTCTIVEQKKITGWKCVANCECQTEAWTQDMNKFCTSLGDCGAYVNINKKVTTEGYSVTGNFKPVLSQTYLNKIVSTVFIGITGKVISGKLDYGNEPTGTAATTVATAAGATKNITKNIKFLSSIENFFKKQIGEKAWNNNPIAQTAAAAFSVYLIGKILKVDAGATNFATFIAGAVTYLVQTKVISGLFGWSAFTTGVVAGVILLIIFKLLGIGDTREKYVNFNCMTWQPPKGGSDCEKCNGDAMKPCSDYRCKSLGASCSLLNQGTGNETCVWLNKDDVNAPTIKPWKEVLSQGSSYSQVQPCPPGPGCWKIVGTGKDSCIKAFTPLEWGITTNEPSQCKIDYNHTSKFDDMQYYFGENNLYLYNHSTRMSLPGPSNLNALSPELKNDGKYTLFIRCKDGNGNANQGEMAVSFCVEAGPDTTPPKIERTSIQNGAGIAAGITSVPLEIYVNEPSQCKWSKTDEAYENMKTSFSCAEKIENMENDFTYKCTTTLTGIQDKVENTFYFRCKDQPYANESDRNVNKQSYVFKLQGTQALNITSIMPNGTINGGFEPITVYLEVETSNGADIGNAKCYYGTSSSYTNMIEFFETGSNEHKQRLDLNAGSYSYYVKCIDSAGNFDTNKTSFSIAIDKTSPVIVRIYKDGEMLKLLTDEDSECAYDIKSCSFDFSKATQMPYANSTEHTAEWRTDIDYYVKCRDVYGNLPTGCSMILHAYDYLIQQ